MRRIVSLFTILMLVIVLNPAAAQDRPMMMPVDTPAGPGTWLFIQPYGNTVGAYNFGTAWYSAGQGLHFGVDIAMPCGTPLVAVADGDVIYVDNLTFGSGPHNLVLRHPDMGVTTLYGHLLDRPPVQQYQSVQRGQVVGYSGDPDLTCDSRPHLHLEVRSLDYRTAYNPVDYIDANWDVLAALGGFNQTLFQMDLTNPRQWMALDDQPPVTFHGARLNAYQFTWPPANSERPPSNPLLPRDLTPLPDDAAWQLACIGYDGCCSVFWWHPTDNRLFAIDGTPGQIANIFQWDSAGQMTLVGQAPRPSCRPTALIRSSQPMVSQPSGGWRTARNGRCRPTAQRPPSAPTTAGCCGWCSRDSSCPAQPRRQSRSGSAIWMGRTRARFSPIRASPLAGWTARACC